MLQIGIIASGSNTGLVWVEMDVNWEGSLLQILVYANLGKMVKILRENPQIREKN
jgi:hypothetical protein